MKFDKLFERDILSHSIRDEDYLRRASRVLASHHFTTKYHSWIWNEIKTNWDKNRECLPINILKNRVKKKFEKSDEFESYIELINQIKKVKGKAPETALDELVEFIRMVNAQTTLEQAIGALESNNVSDAYKVMRHAVRNELKTREYQLIRWMETFDERQAVRKHQKEHPEESIVMPTGFSKIDSVMGGIRLGELGLIMGVTGRGKSIVLTNIGHFNVMKGARALYVSLEMPGRQVATRYDSRWLRMDYKKLKEHNLSGEELKEINRKYNKFKNKYANRLRIVSMPVRRCDINSITGILDDLWIEEKFKPDLILVDSGDHMNPLDNYRDFRLAQAAVYWDLKALAEEGQYGIWSSTHAGREWAEKVATAEAASESYDKARIADIVLSLNIPEKKSRSTKVVDDIDDDDNDGDSDNKPSTIGIYMELFLAKYRDGQSKLTVPIDAIFSEMRVQEIK